MISELLDKAGGFPAFGCYLAEDFFFAKSIQVRFCHTLFVCCVSIPSFLFYLGILRDKTMEHKLAHITNDDNIKLLFIRLNFWLKSVDFPRLEPTNQELIKISKVILPPKSIM